MSSLSGPSSSAPPTGTAAGPAWLSTARSSVTAWSAQLTAAARAWKPPDLSKGLGVKLDVDMLTPALTSVKHQYLELPQPVRDVLPFAGVSLVTSAVVGRLHQSRYGHLRDDHEQLQAQMAHLEGQMSEANMKRTGAFYEIQLAEAVAKAATAAAAAATAAAAAAQSAAAAAPSPAMQQQQQQQRGSRQPRIAQRRRHLEEQAVTWRTQPRRVPRHDASASSWLGSVSSAQQQQQHRAPTPVQAAPLSVTEDGGDSSGSSSGSSWEEREEEPGTPRQQQGAAAAAGARRWRLPFLPR